MIFIFVIMFFLLGYLFYKNKIIQNDIEVEPDIITEMKRNIQPYSGIDPDLYMKYVNNLDMFGNNIENTDIASKYLYSALENLYDLQLVEQEFDFTSIIRENALTGEEILLRSSLLNGNLFVPKYLNK